MGHNTSDSGDSSIAKRRHVGKPRVRLHQILASLSLLVICVFSSGFRGVVLSITDGDTLKVKTGSEVKVVRLEGIDAPEKSQDFGLEAKQALESKVLGQDVEVIECGLDRYGRTIGKIGTVNESMVKEGFAWWFRKYARKNSRLALLEADARLNKRGLWAKEAVAPWEYRKQKSHR